MSTIPTPAAAPAPAATAPVSVNPMALSDADLGSRYVPETIRTQDAEHAEPEVVFGGKVDPSPEPIPVVAEAVPQADGAPAADPAPPAEAPAAPAADAPPLATSFGVFDKQGELEIPRDLEISFKAGGKDLKLPLDRVVRMAQSAPQAEQYRQAAEELPQVKEHATKLEQQYQQLAQEIERNNAIYEQILQDPDQYVRAVQAWQAQNSPEQRAQRAEEKLAALTRQHQEVTTQSTVQRQSAEAYQYAATRIAPAVESMASQYPTLDPAEITAQFHVLTAPLLEAKPGGGVWVPPNKLPQVEALITSEMIPWASGLHAKRHATQQAQSAATAAQVTQAQTQTQLARRQLARVAAPALTPVSPDVPRAKPIKTSGDAMEAALEKVRLQVRGAA